MARRLRRPLVALLAAVGVAFSIVAYASAPAEATSTHEIKGGARTRGWVEIDPLRPATDSTPIIVVLSGINATASQEVSRDGLVPYVSGGQAELIYPVAIGDSWNADGCCGMAASENVNDVAFLQALVARVDPGH